MTSFDLQRVYKLDGVITLVDAANGKNTLDTQTESVKQVALADRIILSKTDLADSKTQQPLIKCLKNINPAVTIIPSNHGEVRVSSLFGLGTYDPYNKSQDVKDWLAAEEYEEDHDHNHHNENEHHHNDLNRHGEHIQAFAITNDKPVSPMSFGFFLELLGAQVGPDLLRVKGIINIEGENRPAVIHGVQHIFHPVHWLDTWPDEDTRTRLVFITRNIQKEEVEGFFRALMGDVKEKVKPQEAKQA